MPETKKDSPSPLPRVAPQSLVTEAHLKAALAADKGTDAEILSWEVKDFTQKGDNYMGFVTSAKIRFHQGENEGEVSYVAKCNPCRKSESFSGISAGAFEKEAKFYTELVPQFNAELQAAGQEPLRMAPCYFSHGARGGEVILLGDLRKEGFKMFDRKRGMDEAHVTLVLKELARLHAASTLLQDKTPQDLALKYDFLQKDFEDMFEGPIFESMLQSSIQTGVMVAENVDEYDKVAAWLRKFSSQVVDHFNECLKKSPPFDVVCHGDCWNNNTLFRYDEDGTPVDVRLLDLQICRKASPALDLNYLMYTSLTGPVRKDNLQVFLKTYYEAFTHVLKGVGRVTPFTLEELRQEYHKKNVFGLIMGMTVIPFVLSEASETMELDTEGDQEDFKKEQDDWLKNQVNNNHLLQSRVLAIFDDMVEYGVIT